MHAHVKHGARNPSARWPLQRATECVIRVTAPIVFGQIWLAPKLARFLDLYPEIDVRLTLVDRTVDLIEEGVDLAIRVVRDLTPGLAARAPCAMQYVLDASPNYLARHLPATPEALNGWRARGNQRFACVRLPEFDVRTSLCARVYITPSRSPGGQWS